jgi:hypothetical protein
MNIDLKLFKWLALLLLLPIGLAVLGGDKFRYPCQDPNNWDKAQCKRPICDVTRTCPDHIFKGQRDPRIDPQATQTAQAVAAITTTPGAACGK